MSNIRLHLAEPNNSKSSYSQFDQVDFTISFEGRKLELNSLRLLGSITLANVADGDDYRVDPMAGAHSFIEEILSSTNNQGLLESVSDYSRYVGMLNNGTESQDSVIRSDFASELITSSSSLSGILTQPYAYIGSSNNKFGATPADFAIKPNICFNNAEGDLFLSWTKTGDLTVSVRLARNSNFCFGTAVDGTTSYSLSDLRMSYRSSDDDGTVGNHVMRGKVCLNQNINSTFSSISAKVPAVCTGVSASAILNSDLGDVQKNGLQQQRLPDVTSVQFLFNDSQNSYITYEIKSQVDVIQRYLESWSEIAENSATLEKLNSNESYGIGLDFEGLVDLSNQKFGIQINSSVTLAHTLFLYFHSVLQL
jgi:hypothetical protein